jgi:F-type H+/Na+-transporting ATPase subunit beta
LEATLLGGEIIRIMVDIISTIHGSITAVEAVYVPADDMADPAVSTMARQQSRS